MITSQRSTVSRCKNGRKRYISLLACSLLLAPVLAFSQARDMRVGGVVIDDNSGNTVSIQVPPGLTSYTLTLPSSLPAGTYVLSLDPSGAITVTDPATMSVQSFTGSLSGDITSTGMTTTIADGSVTSAKIVDSTITSADISPTAAIPYSKLSLINSIQNFDIVANAITTSKVANGTVTTSKMADSAISGLKLLTYAVTDRHIANGAVTLPKIDPTGASSGQVIGYDGTNVTWTTPSGSGTVSRNSTLTGDGSGGSPLGINLGNSNTWTANQTFGGSFLITSNSRIAMVNSDNNARDIRFQEPSGSGTQYIGLRAPAVTNNGNYVFPASVGSAGQVLSIGTTNGIDSATMVWSDPLGGAVVLSYGTVGAGATLTIPNNTAVVRVIDDAASAANSVTMPSGTDGQVLYIYNNDAQALAGGVSTSSGAVEKFIYINSAWHLVN